MAFLRRHWAAILVAAAVAALVVFAYLHRVRFLNGSPYPVGIDGYYYPVQVRSLLERGHLYYPSAPLVLWLMTPVSALTGAFAGPKIVAAAGTALAAAAAYFLGKRLAAGSRPAGLLSAAIVATSAQSFYLSTEFVKQGVGLTFALAFLAVLGAALDRPTRPRQLAAAALLVACILSHKVALGFAVVGATPGLAWHVWRRADPDRRRVYLIALSTGIALLAVSVPIVGAIWPKRFISVGDLLLLGHILQPETDWSFAALIPTRGRPLLFRREIMWAGIVALALLATLVAARRWKAPPFPPLAVGLIAVALFLALPWIDVRDEQAMAFRLRLTAHAALGPLAALLLARVLHHAPEVARGGLAVGFAAGLVIGNPTSSREGVSFAHPAMVTAARAMSGVVPDGANLIVPERKVMFLVAWETRVPARLTPSPDRPPDRMYRVLVGHDLLGKRRETAAALDRLRAEKPPGVLQPRDVHSYEANGLVVVREDTFQWLLARLSPAERDAWLRWETR